MLEIEPPFRRLVDHDGYPRLEDLGLLGDGTTAALVGLDGTVWWLCLPRFDSEPLLSGLLDRQRGGRFVVAPLDVVEARHWYQVDTAVLVTELRTPTGLVQLTDALTVGPGVDLSDDTSAARHELVPAHVRAAHYYLQERYAKGGLLPFARHEVCGLDALIDAALLPAKLDDTAFEVRIRKPRGV